jgi:hypothetical protein
VVGDRVAKPELSIASTRENAIGILDKRFGTQLSDVFHADIQKADEIQLVEWQRRNVFVRFAQRLAQILDKQS